MLPQKNDVPCLLIYVNCLIGFLNADNFLSISLHHNNRRKVSIRERSSKTLSVRDKIHLLRNQKSKYTYLTNTQYILMANYVFLEIINYFND